MLGDSEVARVERLAHRDRAGRCEERDGGGREATEATGTGEEREAVPRRQDHGDGEVHGDPRGVVRALRRRAGEQHESEEGRQREQQEPRA